MKQNKYNYVYVVQGYYDGHWEDLIEWESRKDASSSLWEYRDNEKEYTHRLICRRELAVAPVRGED